jgi:hypothetical protein
MYLYITHQTITEERSQQIRTIRREIEQSGGNIKETKSLTSLVFTPSQPTLHTKLKAKNGKEGKET